MSSGDTPGSITDFLHREIPLARAMEVRVAESGATRTVIEAPLAPNHNHLGTAFGGSLAALATLAGYTLVWLALRDRTAHVVIRESSMKYRHPVRGGLRAICRTPDTATLDTFHQTFARTGKARLALTVEIESGGQVAAHFAGTFVALR